MTERPASRLPGAGDMPMTEAEKQLRALEAVTDVNLSRLSMDELLHEMMERVRDLLEADTAAVLLLDDTGDFLLAAAACGIEEEVRQGSRVPVGLGFAGRIAAERRPVAIDEVTPATVVNPVLLYKGIHSMLGVPLLADDELFGVLHVGTLRRRVFTPQETQLLQQVADRLATAVRIDRTRNDVAASRALQRSLAPGGLPRVPELELAARYVPGSRSGVGGDWYDVFTLPDGRTGAVIGDVMGHGLPAATIMGRIRAALRAFAMTGKSPAEVLGDLDTYLQHFEPGVLASACYLLHAPGSDDVVLASAGHVPPVVVSPRRGAELVPLAEDVLLGVQPDSPRHDVHLDLPPGAMLCLCTDGLLADRSGGWEPALEKLRRLLVVGPGSADLACAGVMAEMVGDRVPADDVALLFLRHRP